MTTEMLLNYVIAAVIVTVLGLIAKIIYDEYKYRRDNKSLHVKIDQINDDNKAMKHYIKDKGVDDFIFDCKVWGRKNFITPEALASLKRRYEDLKDLGANGEREAGKAILDQLQIHEESLK